MQSFSIRDIENLTGIKAHTLRIWEQRYSFFSPKRKQSRHRFYDIDDLKTLLRIAILYHMGWKVSRIASLTPAQVIDEVGKVDFTTAGNNQYINRMIEAAVDFNEAVFVSLMNEIISNIGFEACICQVCYPYLQKIGLLWSTNNIIPAQEHFSSYIIQNRIIAETEKVTPSTRKPEVILICPEGEFHELPLLFINYLFRKNGWSTMYLGTNISRKELYEIALSQNAEWIYLHLITNFTGLYIDEYLENICTSLPGKKIIASGAGISGVQRTFVNLKLLKSDKEIHELILSKSGVRDS